MLLHLKRGSLFLFFLFIQNFVFSQLVLPFAGGGIWPGENKKATAASLKPLVITTDKNGNTYAFDNSYGVIRKISSDSMITTFAGNGIVGYTGDSSDALNASIDASGGMATDINGNLYFSDINNRVIRKIDEKHKITTIAGLGIWPFEGSLASKSNISPTLLALDSNGNTFFYDQAYNVIRKIDSVGKISTIAGNGQYGYSGDSGLAVKAKISVNGLAVDNKGNIFFTDGSNNVIRRITRSGIISTIAGVGSAGYNGDTINAKTAKLDYPRSIDIDYSGNIYFTDEGNNRVRKINKDGIITTLIGSATKSFSGDGGKANNATINYPASIKVDKLGNIYFFDKSNFRIRKISTNGIISTVAGNGTQGNSGDGGAAVNAQLGYTIYIALDNNMNLVLLDQSYGVIKKINSNGIISNFISSISYNDINIDLDGNLVCSNYNSSKIFKINTQKTITIFAGTGLRYSSGDGNQAANSEIYPSNIFVDPNMNIYFSDNLNHLVRKIDNKGLISTIIGNGVAGFSGDGGTSIYAQLNNPKGITVDKNGNIFIADYGNNRIRVVYASGTISTIYGNGSCCSGTTSDGGNAKNTALRPSFIAFDKDNSLYFVDNTVRVKKINSDGIISTIAGNGSSGSTGDGGLATSATLNASYSVSFDKDGQVYIADYSANKIRKINTSGYINNFAGNGLIGQYSGDGAAAINAEMGSLYGICTDNLGNVYASDYDNFVVRKIASNGVISTVAGSGLRGNTGDGGLATDAKLTNPRALSVDRDGNLYIVDVSNNRVRKVDKNGIISTFAGSGTNTGDSILATSAQLGIVRGVYADSTSNNVYIICNYKVRMVDPSGKIYTIAGTGEPGYAGDNGPAKLAMFNAPQGIVKDKKGNLYISDLGNYRIRKISAAGIISTIVGDGTNAAFIDSTKAMNAKIYPWGLSIDSAGTIFFCDGSSYNIYRITPDSLIVRVAGVGVSGNSGDGGDAKKAELRNPLFLNVDFAGNLYFTDYKRIRRIAIPELSSKLIDTLCNNTSLAYTAKSLASDVQFSWTKVGSTGINNTSLIKDSLVNSTNTFSKSTYKIDMNVNGFKNTQLVNMIVRPSLSIPSISRDTANYISSSTFPVIWYKNGTATTDSTQKIKPTSPGSYAVKASQYGCTSSFSESYYYLVTDVINLSAEEFIRLAPNPFINQVNFDFNVKGYQRLNIDVYALSTGNKVATKQGLTPGMPIYFGELSTGTYIIKVVSNDLKINYQFKMVKL